MNKLVLLLLCLSSIVSCGRKSGNTTRLGTAGTANGAAVIGGSVVIYSDCGTGPATVQLGDSSGRYISDQSVNNGGTFSFQVEPQYSYHLAGFTNLCSVSTMNGSAVQPGYSNYRICLSNSSCGSQKMTLMKADGSPSFPQKNISFCAWKTWGCQAGGIGKAEALVESHFRFTAKKALELVLETEFTTHSHWLFTSPEMQGKSWNLSLNTDGTFKAEGTSYSAIVLKSQVTKSSLQFESGFCGSKSELAGKVEEYARLQGFSEASLQTIQGRLARFLPPSETFCAYPQDETKAAKSLSLKANRSLEIRRLWFMILPQIKTAKAGSPIKHSKPVQDALVIARKTNSPLRAVANSPEVLAEDLGLGALVEGL